ncbi:MAG: pyrroline-5-carboxylate reductase [Rhodospirillaceae bacterium]|nr:pyrroline-5-carboxylate reductase [Rhodospirillaceae bacterium]
MPEKFEENTGQTPDVWVPDIWVIGGGKMGQALIRGWLRAGVAAGKLGIIDPKAADHRHFEGLPVAVKRRRPQDLPHFRHELLVLAVKPQSLPQLLPLYQTAALQGCWFLSVVAGQPLSLIQEQLASVAVMRAMPNLPAAYQQGFIGCYALPSLPSVIYQTWVGLLEKLGMVMPVESEQQLDLVTALSGSGPAYIFLFLEVFSAIAQEQGLPPKLAGKLAEQTLLGSAVMASQSGVQPSLLRQQVTSPNGTTAAALRVLMADPGLAGLLRRAVAAAFERARELRKN